MSDAPLFHDVALPGLDEPGVEGEVEDRDPLRPGLADPTPEAEILALTPAQRVHRVRFLMVQAYEIYRDARALAGERQIVASAILFSGGNDSTVLAHLMRRVATHAIHANTGVGIEATRQFVRDVCADWGLPLLEKHPPVSYRQLVLEEGGFPGAPMHFKMYARLKERALDAARGDLLGNTALDRRRKRVIFIAGRRRAESARRSDIPLYEADGSAIWASPLAMWTKLDMQTYRAMYPDVPLNEVSEKIGMSGECLCGAFAKPDELEMIRTHYPDDVAAIDELMAEARAAGIPEPYCRWGHGQGRRKQNEQTGKMCTSCTLPDPLQALIEAQGALPLDLGADTLHPAGHTH